MIENIQEKEKPTTKIVLEFMRHAQKDSESSKWDNERRLTGEGRKQAVERGKELNTNPNVSLGWSSPRQRTQETVLHVMLPDIDANASLEEMKDIIAEEQKYGQKIIIDPKLDFIAEKNRSIRQITKEEGFEENETTYFKAATNVAEIIIRYITIGDCFNRIVSENNGKYSKNSLERYLVTSRGVMELFIARVLEVTGKINEREEFLNSIGNGFNETEGMSVEIVNGQNGQEIKLSYQGNTISFGKDVLEKIRTK